MSKQRFIQRVENYIAHSETKQAIAELLNVLQNTSLHSSVLMQSSRYYQVRMESVDGTISNADAKQQYALIHKALLTILDDLKTSDIAIEIKPRVFISYNRKSPDMELANALYNALKDAGNEPFLDVISLQAGQKWETAITNAIQTADYFLVLLSERSLMSDMVTLEIKLAKELNEREYNPLIILPVRVKLPINVQTNSNISGYLSKIQQVFWNTETDTQEVINKILTAIASGVQPLAADETSENAFSQPNHLPVPNAPLEIPGGGMASDNPFYIQRVGEQQFIEGILKNHALLRIKGPRQYGKTSMMSKALQLARDNGYEIIAISLQQWNVTVLKDLSKLLQQICHNVCKKLKIDVKQLKEAWEDEFLDEKGKCTAFFEDFVLTQSDKPLVLAFDEADRIFEFPEVSNDFFGLLRFWHEESKNNPVWKKIRMAVTYSTEAYMAIKNLNQSPFNVGNERELKEFSQDEVTRFAQIHGLQYQPEQICKIMEMVGGHPFLLHKAFYEIVSGNYTFEQLLETAPTDDGVFGDHLRRHLCNLSAYPEYSTEMKKIVTKEESTNVIVCSKLRAAGLIKGSTPNPRTSFQLYKIYFRTRL